MSITILGAGNVGEALGRAFTQRGESVVFGVREPEKYRESISNHGGQAQVTTTTEAIAASDIVILAVPYPSALDIAKSTANWNGKILVDATNPLAPQLSGLTLGTTTSAAEEVAKYAQGARVVKAFNTTGAENMADTRYSGGPIFMPVCGDDPEARARIVALAASIGFDAVDFGELKAARYLEPFAMTWIHMAYKLGLGRNFAFGRMRR
jgi:predicted dinucleotide-binding enzyme